MVLKKRFFLALLIASLVFIAGCPVPEPVVEDPEEPPVTQPVLEEPAEEITSVFSEVMGGLKLELSLPRVTYRPGELLRATLSIINTTPEEISFSTRTSQLFDLIIKDAGLRWSKDKVFLPVITPRSIAAGQRLSDGLSWEIDLSPGDFYLTGRTVTLDLNGEPIRLKTNPLKIKVE